MPLPSIRIVIAGVDKFSKTINKSLKGIIKIGKAARDIGRKMTIGLTLPIVAFGALTLKTAGDFELSMNRVQNVTQATQSEFTELRTLARQLGRDTVFSANKAAEGMNFLGMAGFNVTEISKAMVPALNIAASQMIDMGEAADILSNILTGYRKSAGFATEVSDVLINTAQNANTSFLQAGQAMSFVGSIAADLQIPFKESATALGLLGNAGFQAERGGTALRNILSKLLIPSRESARVLEGLKIPRSSIFDAKGNITSLRNIMVEFQKSGAKAGDFLRIFGLRAGPAMAALIGQGLPKYDELRKKLDRVGSAQEAADVMTRGWQGQLKLLISAVKDLMIAIGDSGVLSFATKVVKKLTDFAKTLGKLNPKILKWGAIIAGIVATLGPLIAVFGTLIIVVAKAGAILSGVGITIGLLSNPIGWTILGIGSLIGIISYLANHSESEFAKTTESILPLVGVMDQVKNKWERVLPFFRLYGEAIKASMRFLFKNLKPSFMPIVNFFTWLSGWIVKSLDPIISFFEKIASIHLPKWLQRKIGLQVGGLSAGQEGSVAEGLHEKLSTKEHFKSEAVMRFENAPLGLQLQSATPGLLVETERGTLLPEGG